MDEMDVLEEIDYYMTEYGMSEEEAMRMLSMDDFDYDADDYY